MKSVRETEEEAKEEEKPIRPEHLPVSILLPEYIADYEIPATQYKIYPQHALTSARFAIPAVADLEPYAFSVAKDSLWGNNPPPPEETFYQHLFYYPYHDRLVTVIYRATGAFMYQSSNPVTALPTRKTAGGWKATFDVIKQVHEYNEEHKLGKYHGYLPVPLLLVDSDARFVLSGIAIWRREGPVGDKCPVACPPNQLCRPFQHTGDMHRLDYRYLPLIAGAGNRLGISLSANFAAKPINSEVEVIGHPNVFARYYKPTHPQDPIAHAPRTAKDRAKFFATYSEMCLLEGLPKPTAFASNFPLFSYEEDPSMQPVANSFRFTSYRDGKELPPLAGSYPLIPYKGGVTLPPRVDFDDLNRFEGLVIGFTSHERRSTRWDAHGSFDPALKGTPFFISKHKFKELAKEQEVNNVKVLRVVCCADAAAIEYGCKNNKGQAQLRVALFYPCGSLLFIPTFAKLDERIHYSTINGRLMVRFGTQIGCDCMQSGIHWGEQQLVGAHRFSDDHSFEVTSTTDEAYTLRLTSQNFPANRLVHIIEDLISRRDRGRPLPEVSIVWSPQADKEEEDRLFKDAAWPVLTDVLVSNDARDDYIAKVIFKSSKECYQAPSNCLLPRLAQAFAPNDYPNLLYLAANSMNLNCAENFSHHACFAVSEEKKAVNLNELFLSDRIKCSVPTEGGLALLPLIHATAWPYDKWQNASNEVYPTCMERDTCVYGELDLGSVYQTLMVIGGEEGPLRLALYDLAANDATFGTDAGLNHDQVVATFKEEAAPFQAAPKNPKAQSRKEEVDPNVRQNSQPQAADTGPPERGVLNTRKAEPQATPKIKKAKKVTLADRLSALDKAAESAADQLATISANPITSKSQPTSVPQLNRDTLKNQPAPAPQPNPDTTSVWKPSFVEMPVRMSAASCTGVYKCCLVPSDAYDLIAEKRDYASGTLPYVFGCSDTAKALANAKQATRIEVSNEQQMKTLYSRVIAAALLVRRSRSLSLLRRDADLLAFGGRKAATHIVDVLRHGLTVDASLKPRVERLVGETELLLSLDDQAFLHIAHPTWLVVTDQYMYREQSPTKAHEALAAYIEKAGAQVVPLIYLATRLRRTRTLDISHVKPPNDPKKPKARNPELLENAIKVHSTIAPSIQVLAAVPSYKQSHKHDFPSVVDGRAIVDLLAPTSGVASNVVAQIGKRLDGERRLVSDLWPRRTDDLLLLAHANVVDHCAYWLPETLLEDRFTSMLSWLYGLFCGRDYVEMLPSKVNDLLPAANLWYSRLPARWPTKPFEHRWLAMFTLVAGLQSSVDVRMPGARQTQVPGQIHWTQIAFFSVLAMGQMRLINRAWPDINETFLTLATVFRRALKEILAKLTSGPNHYRATLLDKYDIRPSILAKLENYAPKTLYDVPGPPVKYSFIVPHPYVVILFNKGDNELAKAVVPVGERLALRIASHTPAAIQALVTMRGENVPIIFFLTTEKFARPKTKPPTTIALRLGAENCRIIATKGGDDTVLVQTVEWLLRFITEGSSVRPSQCAMYVPMTNANCMGWTPTYVQRLIHMWPFLSTVHRHGTST